MAMSDSGMRRIERGVGLSFLRDAKFKREAAMIAPYLDTRYYLENNSDVAAAGMDASLHYAKYGWREGRDPSPSFSTKGYLSAHPHVALEGANPLLHFIQNGREAQETRSDDAEVPSEGEVALVEEHMDASYYRSTCPDHVLTGLSPARHYCRFGWREGADPAPDFSTCYYLTTNPDVRDCGVNPFWHYLVTGRSEGRLPIHPGGWRHRVLSKQTTFEAYCDGWKRRESPDEALDAGAVVERLDAGRKGDKLLVSIGHDDYRATPGGVQLCIGIEEREAVLRSTDYLNLHPWQPLPKFAEAGSDPLLVLVLNGRSIGTALASAIVEAVSRIDPVIAGADLVIHHLAGHAPEAVAEISESLGINRVRLWLHDYFTLCTSYALQRNNVSQCNAPDPGSNACGICLFGAERVRQAARMSAFFERLEVDVVSPSEAALEFWKSRSTLPTAGEVVHPHMVLSPTGTPDERDTIPDAPVRIAFIGTAAPHKGWPVFRELQRRLQAEPGHEFWYFGASDPALDGIRHVETHVRASDPGSVLRAISANRIDLVLHWAAWRETFSFSTFEALGGGAFVLTNEGSGNVAAAVTEQDRGLVLEDSEALFALAKAGGLRTLAEKARAARQSTRLAATFSKMTLDLIGPGGDA